MNLIKTIALVGLITVPAVSADNTKQKLPDKQKLIEYSESMDKLLQNVECSFTKKLKLLPAWYELNAEQTKEHPPIRNNDGYNCVEEVLYRRNDPKWYVRESNVTDDDKKHFQCGKHFDGMMFWETHDYQNPVGIYINDQLPNVPIFIDRILSRFPSDTDGYERVYQSEVPIQKAPTLKDILNNAENEIRILPIKADLFKVMVIHQNPKHTFAGMKLLKEFYFDTKQKELRLVKYQPTAMYIKDGFEYIFHPHMEVIFSDFMSVSGSEIEVPRNIQTINLSADTKRYTKKISNADDLMSLDKAGWIVPDQEDTIIISSFNKEFSFEKGDIAFNYEVGTEYWDHRDKKKYYVGETNPPTSIQK